MAEIKREFVVVPLPASVAHRSLVQMLEGRAAMLDRSTSEGASLYVDLMEAADVICKLSAEARALLYQAETTCTCTTEGCDGEGDPGCTFCRLLDGEMPCPMEES